MPRREAKFHDANTIIDPHGMGLFRLVMMVVTASICGGIFSLAGDLAAGGAHSAAVLIGWIICFAGVFCLMMCFNGLSQVRPDLTGGIYAYAAAGFTKFVGFNSAWGYWISACLSNVSFAIMLFGALGYFFHGFEHGNNLASCLGASLFLWLLVALVTRGVKEAAGINVVVTIAKLVPLALFVLTIALLGKFSPEVFAENFWGEAGGPDLGAQIVSTMIALVWIFTGIEGAVVISGRAKYARDVGRATCLSFLIVFFLYVAISIESLGVMSRAQMAELATPSMAGVLEYALGPIGAGIVNLGVILSLLGAMIGYIIISAETPFEAARQGVFPKAFARTNKRGAPVVTVIISAGITQLFLIVSVFSEQTYQFFYACAVSTILIPYVCSAAYYMKIAWQGEHFKTQVTLRKARFFGTMGFIYTIFLVWAAGLVGVIITTVLFAPGIIVYGIGEHQRAARFLPHLVDKIIAITIVGLMLLSVMLLGTGTIQI